MADIQEAVTTVTTGVSLAMLWVLFYWLYRDYRIDRFREDLFSLRDEVFDMGASGKAPFEHRAYGMLRSNINGAIRHGHRLGLLDLMVFAALARRPDQADGAREYTRAWKAACAELDPEVASKLHVIRGRLHYLMAEQIIFTSPLLLSTLIAVLLWGILSRISGSLPRVLRRLLGSSFVDDMASAMDYEAKICSELAHNGQFGCAA